MCFSPNACHSGRIGPLPGSVTRITQSRARSVTSQARSRQPRTRARSRRKRPTGSRLEHEDPFKGRHQAVLREGSQNSHVLAMDSLRRFQGIRSSRVRRKVSEGTSILVAIAQWDLFQLTTKFVSPAGIVAAYGHPICTQLRSIGPVITSRLTHPPEISWTVYCSAMVRIMAVRFQRHSQSASARIAWNGCGLSKKLCERMECPLLFSERPAQVNRLGNQKIYARHFTSLMSRRPRIVHCSRNIAVGTNADESARSTRPRSIRSGAPRPVAHVATVTSTYQKVVACKGWHSTHKAFLLLTCAGWQLNSRRRLGEFERPSIELQLNEDVSQY